jgi:hypothetical protein
LIGTIGSGEIYLVRGPALADYEKRVLYIRRQRSDIERPVFFLQDNVRSAEKGRLKTFRKFDPGKPLGRDQNRNGFSFPFDDPGVKDGRKE